MMHTLDIAFLMPVTMLVGDLQQIKCRPFHSVSELDAWEEVVVEREISRRRRRRRFRRP